ncbi:MAG: DNA translocase FtsK [Patescibacteria group bacterium]
MAKEKERNQKENNRAPKTSENNRLHPDIKKSIWIVVFLGFAILLILAAASQAGPWGNKFYLTFNKLFGWGYYLLPTVSFLLAFSFFAPDRKRVFSLTLIGGLAFIASGLGFIDILSPGNGGLTGNIIGSLKNPFGIPAAIVITLTAAIASFLVTVNKPLKFRTDTKSLKTELVIKEPIINLPLEAPAAPNPPAGGDERKNKPTDETKVKESGKKTDEWSPSEVKPIKNYVAPPLSLLTSSVEKPTIGDLRANANIIKRTLESFGVPVEMGEINVGPTVTRYTLKPAEGVKITKITTLNQDLALALAAHPIRIEAPIPGKSLVGIEVPNKAAALVRLGSLLLYPEFQKANSLTFALGRNVQGEPIIPDIEKMPHLLIAGATGSGKSIAIHSLLISLLFKNSPEMLKFIMIDPKRVELSIYDGLPHLIAPVVTDNKKALAALRWVIEEMDRRYQTLLEAGARDIKSYNSSSLRLSKSNDKNGKKMSFILVVIDEMADLMTSYGREVEGSIIRLAQMSRATGIHLLVSTQRPSVEVITGLIKANITCRVALQVASQIDSRTIIDTAGAEKLLGSGDLLFISAENSKPMRIQGGYLTEEEIKKVVAFIKKNNEPAETATIETAKENAGNLPNFDDYETNENDDALYEEAVVMVRTAKKASASLLQRRFKVGYARAARLLDMMEERGVVGPGEGAKPREVYE